MESLSTRRLTGRTNRIGSSLSPLRMDATFLNYFNPASPRTFFTPATMFLNFSRAAHRAVWLSPQSGANDNRSAGACRKQARTRLATSSTVSM